MDWLIRESEQIRFHTDLRAILAPFTDNLDKYCWFISDLELLPDQFQRLKINLDLDYLLLSAKELKTIWDAQFIWGTILAIPRSLTLTFRPDVLPYVEGNDSIWRPGNIQLKEAEIEIDCFDSGYTIVKFRNTELSDTFIANFPEASRLE